MNAAIFKDWLIKLGKKFKIENRNVLLFLDNFSGHHDTKNSQILKLTNIKLIYFPANCTSVCQPMDQGIIQSFKVHYRKLIVTEKIECIEYGCEMPAIDVYSAIKMINKAWIAVTASTIRNCFKKAGFRNEMLTVDDSKDDDIDNSLNAYTTRYSKLCELENTKFDKFDK